MEILPEEIIVAYRQTGLLPCRNRFGDGRTCGCPLTAYAVSRGLDLKWEMPGKVGDLVLAWFRGSFPGEDADNYCYHFVHAVDTFDFAPVSGISPEAARHGNEAWGAVKAWLMESGAIRTTREEVA